MSLQQDIPELLGAWKQQESKLYHNQTLFEIHEGNLLKYILEDLQRQLSPQSFEQIKHRIAPINVLKRLIDKLSKIYTKPPIRTCSDDGSKEILEYYTKEFNLNSHADDANKYFNLFKSSALEPYLEDNKPRLRVLTSDKFFVYSKNTVNPLRVTHFVKIMGKYKEEDGQEVMLFYAYTDNEFLAFNSNGDLADHVMNQPEVAILEGKNPYGVIPQTYINRSRQLLVPEIDSDTLQMTKLIPILLSDLNFAVMYLSFSITYGIDLDDQNLERSPNAFWSFKSQAGRDSKPQIGTIKPDVDIQQVLNLIETELTFWMNSRNIRPGSIGTMRVQNTASGIAKAIDEMDTSEDRAAQVPFFVAAEQEFFNKLINNIHPVWAKTDGFEMKKLFASNAEVTTQFAEQKPLVDQTTLLDDGIKKLINKLDTTRGILKTLNPDWTDVELDEKVLEIEEWEQEEADDPAPAPGTGKTPVAAAAAQNANGNQGPDEGAKIP